MSLQNKTRQEDGIMDSLRQEYPHLYQQGGADAAQSQLQWERLWMTSNNEYGPFAQGTLGPMSTAHAQGGFQHVQTTPHQINQENIPHQVTVHQQMYHPGFAQQMHQQSSPQQTTQQFSVGNEHQQHGLPPTSQYHPSYSYQNTTDRNMNVSASSSGVLPPVSTLLSTRPRSQAQGKDLQPFPVFGPAEGYMQQSCAKFWENIESLQ